MKFFIPLLLLLLIIGCDNDEKPSTNACNATTPVDEIDWLLALKQSMTNCSCEISIIEGMYHSQTVFFIALTDPLCDGINTPTLYNCEGIGIKTFTTSEDDQTDLADNVTRDSVLYRCKD